MRSSLWLQVGRGPFSSRASGKDDYIILLYHVTHID